jgi:integrase
MKLYQKKPGGHWFCRFKVRGYRYRRDCHTTDKREAGQVAKEFHRLAMEKEFSVLRSLRARGSTPWTFGDILKRYDKAQVQILARTKAGNTTALLRVCGATIDDPATKLADARDAESRLLAGVRDLPAREQRAKQTSYNSYLRHAKSVFASRLMEAGVYDGMDLDIAPLMKLKAVRVPNEPWQAMPAEVVKGVVAGIRDLEELRNMLAIPLMLALYAGMRRGECAAAKWEWLRDDGITIGDDDYLPKSGQRRFVPMSPDVVARLRKFAGNPTDPMVIAYGPHLPTHRSAFEHAADWLKQHGIKDRKPFHALRKLFGSLVCQSQGLFAAQRMLGHSSPTITERHYLGLLNPPSPVEVPA